MKMGARSKVRKISAIAMMVLLLPWGNLPTDHHVEVSAAKVQSNEKKATFANSAGESAETESEYLKAFAISEDTKKHYYNTILSENGKKVYKAIEVSVLKNIKTADTEASEFEFNFETVLQEDELKAAVDENYEISYALAADHPEWYWMDPYTITVNQTGFKMKIASDAGKKEVREEVEKQILSKVQAFENGLSDTSDTYTVVKEIHDWIIKNTYYDVEAPNKYNVRGVLLDGKGVCDSYTRASQMLFNYFNIQSIFVSGKRGTGKNAEGHSWNQVYMTPENYWVNYDATWDDLIQKAEDEKDYKEFDGISYRYFLRNDAQFTHSKEQAGKYELEFKSVVHSCTTEKFSYFAKHPEILYLHQSTDSAIKAFMTSLENQVKSMNAIDGDYFVRMGHDATVDLAKIESRLQNEIYQVVDYKGTSGDYILIVRDKRKYTVTNLTAPDPKVKIYATMQEYKSGTQTWNTNIDKTLNCGHKSFYIKTAEGISISSIQYWINDGSEKYIPLKDYLKPVENEEHLYLFTLPGVPTIAPSDNVKFKVSFSTEPTLNVGFEEENYFATYGDKITMKLKVAGDGTHEPTGTFKIYYDQMDDKHEIKRLSSMGITNHEIIYELNGNAEGAADIGAGNHTIYAQYQRDSGDEDEQYFKLYQVASTQLTIAKATLKYKAEKVEAEYGEPIDIKGTYEGFVHGDDKTIIAEADQPKFKTTATSSSKPGTYAITVGTKGRCDKYNIVPEVGSANVTIKKTEPNIKVTVEKRTEDPVLGETIQIKAELFSSKNETVRGKATTTLYLGTNKVGDFIEKDGIYTCSYTIPNDSPSNLSFYVKTGASEYFTEKISEEVKVAVDTERAYVFYDNNGYGKPVEPVICKIGEKITAPNPAPYDPDKKVQLVGWFKSVSTNEKWNFEEDTLPGSMTLYGRWAKPQLENITDVKITPYTEEKYDGEKHDVVKFEGLRDTDRVTYVLDNKVYNDMPQVKDVLIGANGQVEGHSLKILIQRDWANDYQAEFSLVIYPIKPELHVPTDKVEKQYTGNAIDVSSSVTVTGAPYDDVPKNSIVYRYYKDKDCSEPTTEAEGAETIGGAPKDAGEYYVKVIFNSAGNYTETFKIMHVEITKKEVLVLDNVNFSVPAKQRTEGKYRLQDMIPVGKNLGDVSLEVIGVKENANDILESYRQDEEGYLHYIIKETAEVGQSVSFNVEVTTKNYVPTTIQLIIKIKDKKLVKISIKGIEDKDYDGQPFSYQGPYETKLSSNDTKLDLALKTHYIGTRKDGLAYNSETAPTDAGNYELILEVPSDQPEYRGRESFAFQIRPKEVSVEVEDCSIPVGAAIPTYTAKCIGLVGEDQIKDLSFNCKYKQSDQDIEATKIYDIEVSGGTLTKPWNYKVKYVNGKLYVKLLRKVTFNIGINGAKVPAPMNAIEGEEVIMPAATAIKEGCLFVGWSYKGTVYKTNAVFRMPDEDVEFVATWEEKTRVVGIKVKYSGATVPVGTELKKSDFVVNIHYSNGKTEETTNFTMEGNKIEKEGTNVVTITYLTFKEKVTIKGVINHMKRVTASYKGNVLVGTRIDTNQLTVTLHYDDGKTEVITKDYVVESYNIKLGKNTLKLTYKELTTTFEVTGIAAEGQAVLTFDSQGGSSVNKAVVEVGKTYQPPTPSKSGYVFDGWYTSSGIRFTGSTIVDGSKTLYARWIVSDATGTYRIRAVYYGELKAGPLKQEDFKVSETNNIGVQNLVTGFTLNPSSLKVGVNYVMVTYNHVSVLVTLNVPDVPQKISVTTKEKVYGAGYQLQNKDLHVTAVDADGKTIELTEKEFTLSNNVIKNGINVVDITYEGKKETFEVLGRNSYTVFFVTNGDKDIEPIQVIEGAVIGKLPVPKRKQYRFLGWFLDEDCKKRCTESNKVTKNMTLYADWESDNDYKISKKKVHVNVNGQESIYIDGAKNVQWISEDMDIAYIDRDGIITGIAPGTVVITGYTDDGYELDCLVTVGTLVKKIEVSKTRVSLKKGKKYALKASVLPSKAATKKLSYSSSNSKVAKVSATGVITAVKKGTCYITISTLDVSKVERKVKVIVK